MGMNTEEHIKARISNNITSYYPEINPIKVQISIKQQKDFFSMSTSERFLCITKVKDEKGKVVHALYAKNNFKNPEKRVKYKSKTEFLNLMHLWDSYYSDEKFFKIPKPLDYIEKIDTMLVEYVPGDNFLMMLTRYLLPVLRTIKKKEIEERIKQAANWLSLFQKVTYTGKKKSIGRDILKARDYLNELTFIKAEFKKRIIKALEERVLTLPQIPITACHGQFVPRNIILLNPGIAVLDFETLYYEHIFFDVHSFLTNLESRSRFPFYSLTFIKSLKKVFLNEYLEGTHMESFNDVFNTTKILYLISYLNSNFKYKTHNLFMEQFKQYVLKELSKSCDYGVIKQ